MEVCDTEAKEYLQDWNKGSRPGCENLSEDG